MAAALVLLGVMGLSALAQANRDLRVVVSRYRSEDTRNEISAACASHVLDALYQAEARTRLSISYTPYSRESPGGYGTVLRLDDLGQSHEGEGSYLEAEQSQELLSQAVNDEAEAEDEDFMERFRSSDLILALGSGEADGSVSIMGGGGLGNLRKEFPECQSDLPAIVACLLSPENCDGVDNSSSSAIQINKFWYNEPWQTVSQKWIGMSEPDFDIFKDCLGGMNADMANYCEYKKGCYSRTTVYLFSLICCAKKSFGTREQRCTLEQDDEACAYGCHGDATYPCCKCYGAFGPSWPCPGFSPGPAG